MATRTIRKMLGNLPVGVVAFGTKGGLVAGFHHWQQDALRHTFASMHLRRFGNPPLLQSEMGHRDSTLLRTRYVNMHKLTTYAAASFWK